MKPVVVLIGRPNVGKSTLFNRLTRSRSALVADAPGLTRDRQYGDGRVGDRPYLLVDTGGIADRFMQSDKSGDEGLLQEIMSAQTRQALNEADCIIFLVDGREGVTVVDQGIAADLRRLGKPVWLAVNKTEGLDPDLAVADFHELGLGQPVAISSAHGDGVAAFMHRVLAALPAVKEEPSPDAVPRIAVAGRPNVGKSTLVNALLGEERVVVSDQPGTTRDSIYIPLERNGQHYILVDTAGVRRRARISDTVEKYSVIKTLQAIDGANVVILVLDAQAGISEQDASLAGYIMERGRAMALAVNKWDALDSGARAWAKREPSRKLPFLDFAKVHTISALHGAGIGSLFGSVDSAFRSANKTLTTSKLNRVLRDAVRATPPPVVHGRRIQLKYAHQGGRNPPLVVIHGNQATSLPPSYRRYLSNTFRRAFRLVGTPVRIQCRQGENPYRPSSKGPRRKKARGHVQKAKKY